MTKISEAAWKKANELSANPSAGVAAFIQSVSDAAKIATLTAADDATTETLAPFILPDPVDPIILAARQVVIDTLDPDAHKSCSCREAIDAGEWDNAPKMKIAIAALRRGMEWQGK